MSIPFTLGFIAYMGLMIFIGWYFSRGKNTGEDFLTGGRSLPFYLLFGTVAASLIGTGSSMGATANGFRNGWGGSVYGIGAVIGIASLILFCSARKYNFLTMAEEGQFYYGGNRAMRWALGFMMYLITIVWLGNHMNGGAKYLAYVTGLDDLWAKIFTALAFVIYVYIGGYMAVVWTDFFQLAIILVGFFGITVAAIPMAGGFEAIEAAYAAAGKSEAMGFLGLGAIGILPAITLILSTALGTIGTPTHRTRIYTANTEKTAKRAFLTTSIVFAVFCVIPSIIGMVAFTIASQHNNELVMNNPDFAFSYMATTVLGPTLGLMFLIAGLSATLSSGDSDAICGVTIFLTDVMPTITGKHVSKDDYVKYSRIALVVTVLLAFVATLYAKDVIGYINTVVGSFLPGTAIVMLMGRLWKRATWQGGLATLIVGTGFGALYLVSSSFNSYINGIFSGPSIPVSILTLATCVIVSLLTPANTVTEEEALKLVMESREGRR